MIVFSQMVSVGESRRYKAVAYEPDMKSILIKHPDGEEVALRIPLLFVSTKANKFDEQGLSTQKESWKNRLFTHNLPRIQDLEDLEKVAEVPAQFNRMQAKIQGMSKKDT